MATKKTIRIGATMDVLLRRLKHERSGIYPPTASVSYTLFDAAGDPVAGAADMPMTFIAATNPNDGIYSGELAATVTVGLTDGAAYTILMIATAVDGTIRPFPMECIAKL